MKEIDFLPSWYKADRKRQIGRRNQYIILGAVFALMMIWNFVTVSSVSTANAQVELLAEKFQDAEKVSEQYSSLQKEIDQLNLRTDIVKITDSNIDVAATLAEISYLLGDRIVLHSIAFKSESNAGGNWLKSNPKSKTKEKPSQNRFRVSINGIASDAASVAELIVRLENSPYFTQVIPSYSRNKQVSENTSRASQQYQVSEFEISCYLANYKEKNNQNLSKTGSGQGNL
jgi:Tfp pilus assembly protein PilN